LQAEHCLDERRVGEAHTLDRELRLGRGNYRYGSDPEPLAGRLRVR